MSKGPASHLAQSEAPAISDLGTSTCTVEQVYTILSPHFRQESYDLLRKNCNHFSDCAVFVLLRERLDPQYYAIDRLASGYPSLVRFASGGRYEPNPEAEGFDVNDFVKGAFGSSCESRGSCYAIPV